MDLTTGSPTRTVRLDLRATLQQLQIIKVAAARQGKSASDFILESACEKAERSLSERTGFVLDSKQWAQFMEALDRPPRVIPKIRKLFAKPPVATSR